MHISVARMLTSIRLDTPFHSIMCGKIFQLTLTSEIILENSCIGHPVFATTYVSWEEYPKCMKCVFSFTALSDSSSQLVKYGRTYGDELNSDLDNHGTLVAGIIKEKGPFNIRFYNFKVNHFCPTTLSCWRFLPSIHGLDFHWPQSQITIDSPDFHPRRFQKYLLGSHLKWNVYLLGHLCILQLHYAVYGLICCLPVWTFWRAFVHHFTLVTDYTLRKIYVCKQAWRGHKNKIKCLFFGFGWP